MTKLSDIGPSILHELGGDLSLMMTRLDSTVTCTADLRWSRRLFSWNGTQRSKQRVIQRQSPGRKPYSSSNDYDITTRLPVQRGRHYALDALDYCFVRMP